MQESDLPSQYYLSSDEPQNPSDFTLFDSLSPTLNLPDFDSGSSTRKSCVYALLFGGMTCLACFTTATAMFVNRELDHGLVVLRLATMHAEPISLVVNLGLTLCLDGLGYIHLVSLRWALYRERRLHFNTNLRLLTSSRHTKANRWYSNLIFAACLILCYAATSMLLMPWSGNNGLPPKSCLNPVAIFTLGLGLLGCTSIATWCMFSSLRKCPSWSSNPLNTTLVVLHLKYLQHRPGRCMIPAERNAHHAAALRPTHHQNSLRKTLPTLYRSMWFMWLLVILAFIWTTAIIVDSAYEYSGQWEEWRFKFQWSLPLARPGWHWFISLWLSSDDAAASGAHLGIIIWLIFAILFTCAFQGLQTMGLHLIELFVNANRDEEVWRCADVSQSHGSARDSRGAQLEVTAFTAALSSWQYVALFIMKAFFHWLLGQCLYPVFVDGQGVILFMSYSRLIIYPLSTIFPATFVMYLGCRRPRGPQPCAWGHLQTLADLIDNWDTDEQGRLWWGDMTPYDRLYATDDVRHAGTSAVREVPGCIQSDSFYAGRWPNGF